jgi:acyl carrier protein
MSELNSEYYLVVSVLIGEVSDGQQRVSPEEVKGKHLRKDLNFDSLDVIKFVFMLEEKTGVKLPDKEIDALNLLDIDSLVAYLEKNKNSAHA